MEYWAYIHVGLRFLIAHLLLPFVLIYEAIKFFTVQRKDLRGKIIMVTGAGNGLGREMARQLSKEGCTLLCLDMKKEDLEDTIRLVQEENPQAKIDQFVCDITDKVAVEKMRDSVLKKYGRLDMLFNNAAIIFAGKFDDATENSIRRVIDVNILGNIWMTRAFLPSMKEKQQGHIVYTNSVSALMQAKDFVIYSTTKSALSTFVMSLREELMEEERSKNIVLSSAYPYFIDNGEFTRRLLKTSVPAVDNKDVAFGIIDGARRNFLDFSVPGNPLTYSLIFMAKILPTMTYNFMKKSFEYEVATLTEPQGYDEFMSEMPNKVLYEKYATKLKFSGDN